MRVIDFSVRRPVTVFIFAVAAVVFGIVAFRQLAVDLLPDITYPSLTVRTEWEGAAPVEMENLVSKPVEDAVGVVNNVVRVTSSSRADTSEVTLEFSWGTNMDFASLDVRERLDMIRLPLDTDKPVLLRYDPSLDPILRVGVTGLSDLVRMRLIAEEDVKRALERIDGVAAVLVSGGLEEEIQIDIDENKLTGLGLNISQLVARLAAENVNLTGGRLREGQTEYLVRTINEFVKPEDMREIVVDRSQGAIVRLSDVARVYKGTKEREVITRIDGLESVEIAVYKEGGTNTVMVAAAVEEGLREVEEKLLRIDPSLQLTVITDQSRYIEESVRAVISTAVMGGALAIVVLFLFLRSAKNTLIIAVSIPVSVMATFFLMYIFDVSLNIMSLGGLTLGIGLLLDNSIVVLEAIQRKREEGLDIVESARVGASEVGRAVIASTLTTICVFAPIVFIEGIAGQLFGDQAMTVTFSLVVSLVVALTVIPMLASRYHRRDEALAEEQSVPTFFLLRWIHQAVWIVSLGIARSVKITFRAVAGLLALLVRPVLLVFDYALRAVAAAYDGAVAWVLRYPWAVIVGTIALLALCLTLVGGLGTELVPELIQGEFYIDTELPPGSRLEVTDRRMAAVERRGMSLEGVRTVYTMIGTSNEQGGAAGEKRENIGQVTFTLVQPSTAEQEEELMSELRSFLREQNAAFTGGGEGVEEIDTAPGAMKYRFGRPSYFSFRTPIEVEIRGYNLKVLERLSEDVVLQLRAIDGLADVKSSTEGGNPELQIRFDRERLASYGYTVNQIGSVIRSKVKGDIATDITREDRNIEIRVRSSERFRDSVRDLGNLNISQSGTTRLPLSAVAEVVETYGPAEIRRADSSRVALITASLTGSRDLGSVSADIEAVLDGLSLPTGFDYTLGGQRQEMQTSFESMRLAILLAVFMVYLVMASQFESLLHPFVILFSVPFSLIGAIAILWATGTTISIVVLIGAILLAGIVVNNAIILVDYTNQLRREGLSKVEALRKAGGTRLRPILMTTATTVLGLLPMAMGLGEGSELRAPMALTVVGGLLTSTFLTLLVIPAVYSVLDRGR